MPGKIHLPLLRLYDESLLNPGQPECLFAETLIFNEGWLLRSVLNRWKTQPPSSTPPFLPFPEDARVFSEGQLYTPFRARRRGDPEAETNSRVDGIAGHFSIASGTKSGIVLVPHCRYIAVFEAKLYSRLAKGITNEPDYDQVSRTTACLIQGLLEARPQPGCKAHVVVLYPQDNLSINPSEFAKVHIGERIGKRLNHYKLAGETAPHITRFEASWEEALRLVEVHFETWEKVLSNIADGQLNRFYGLCKRFNRPPAGP